MALGIFHFVVFLFFEAHLWFYVPRRSIFLLAGLCFNIACNKRQVQGSVLTSDLFLNIGCNKRQVQGSVLT